MDSDVILSSNSISEIVRGFSGYNVAAVCGNTSVANENKNILTRVQSQYYYISYRTFKSSEAYFRTVLCCNGCFSAYRSDRLFSVMDEWQSQTFLGTKRTFSDDRSLTNLLLKEGWDTVYHPGAKSSTYVPEKLSEYVNQQTRWRKGFFIEYLALITAVPLWTFAANILIPLALLTIKGTRWLTRSHSSETK